MSQKMVTSEQANAIYRQFSKAPILEMVQSLIDKSVDAQTLRDIQLLDAKHHKNKHVQSHTSKVCDCYERICKILVMFPSLAFKACQLTVQKDKETKFLTEFYYDSHPLVTLSSSAHSIVELGNIALLKSVSDIKNNSDILKQVALNESDLTRIIHFLTRLTGDPCEFLANLW